MCTIYKVGICVYITVCVNERVCAWTDVCIYTSCPVDLVLTHVM